MAARLAGAGMKVAIVERDRFGGTCVNNGCTPTKAMVASAYAAHSGYDRRETSPRARRLTLRQGTEAQRVSDSEQPHAQTSLCARSVPITSSIVRSNQV